MSDALTELIEEFIKENEKERGFATTPSHKQEEGAA